jgi:hypothetical protein
MDVSSTLKVQSMASPAQETKIELATEAIETLVLAVVILTAPARNPDEHRANHKNVLDARALVRGALKELLAPALRLVAAADVKINHISAPDARPVYPAA